jgi:hypothetical protein
VVINISNSCPNVPNPDLVRNRVRRYSTVKNNRHFPPDYSEVNGIGQRQVSYQTTSITTDSGAPPLGEPAVFPNFAVFHGNQLFFPQDSIFQIEFASDSQFPFFVVRAHFFCSNPLWK